MYISSLLSQITCNDVLLYLFPVFYEELCLPRNTNNLNLKLNGSNGTLQSPMEDYFSLQCEWLINVPEGKVIELSFERFQLFAPTNGRNVVAVR